MTVEELKDIIDSINSFEIREYDIQFHKGCIWYHIDELDQIDHNNKRIIFKSKSKTNKSNKEKENK